MHAERDRERERERAREREREREYRGLCLHTCMCTFIMNVWGFEQTRFLDAVSKPYGKSKFMGETFWTEIVNLQFPSATTKFPFVRTTLVTANLCCPKNKMVDGKPRLITKTDMQAIVRKQLLLQVQAAETVLAEHWETIAELQESGKLTIKEAYAAFGKLTSRVALYLLKKQKDGFEGKTANFKEFVSFVDIKERTKAEMGLAGATAQASTPENDDVASTESQVGLDTVSDPKWIAAKAGFKIGGIFTHKESRKLYRLDEYAAANVRFTEVHLGPRDLDELSVGYDDLIFKKQFIPYAGKLQEKVTADLTPYHVDNNKHIASELIRVHAFQKLVEFATMQALSETMVEYFVNPSEVRAKEKIATGDLVLVPLTDSSKVLLKSSTAKVTMTSGNTTLYLEAPAKPKGLDATEWRKDTIVAAYWSVKTTDKKAESNLKVRKINDGVYTISAYVNTKVLNAFDKLVLYEQPAPMAKRARHTESRHLGDLD